MAALPNPPGAQWGVPVKGSWSMSGGEQLLYVKLWQVDRGSYRTQLLVWLEPNEARQERARQLMRQREHVEEWLPFENTVVFVKHYEGTCPVLPPPYVAAYMQLRIALQAEMAQVQRQVRQVQQVQQQREAERAVTEQWQADKQKKKQQPPPPNPQRGQQRAERKAERQRLREQQLREQRQQEQAARDERERERQRCHEEEQQRQEERRRWDEQHKEQQEQEQETHRQRQQLRGRRQQQRPSLAEQVPPETRLHGHGLAASDATDEAPAAQPECTSLDQVIFLISMMLAALTLHWLQGQPEGSLPAAMQCHPGSDSWGRGLVGCLLSWTVTYIILSALYIAGVLLTVMQAEAIAYLASAAYSSQARRSASAMARTAPAALWQLCCLAPAAAAATAVAAATHARRTAAAAVAGVWHAVRTAAVHAAAAVAGVWHAVRTAAVHAAADARRSRQQPTEAQKAPPASDAGACEQGGTSQQQAGKPASQGASERTYSNSNQRQPSPGSGEPSLSRGSGESSSGCGSASGDGGEGRGNDWEGSGSELGMEDSAGTCTAARTAASTAAGTANPVAASKADPAVQTAQHEAAVPAWKHAALQTELSVLHTAHTELQKERAALQTQNTALLKEQAGQQAEHAALQTRNTALLKEQAGQQAEHAALQQLHERLRHQMWEAAEAQRAALEGVLDQHCCCPITQDVLVDPVVTADGHTFERAAMEEWMSRHSGSRSVPSPATNLVLPSRQLAPNLALRSLVGRLQEMAAGTAGTSGTAGAAAQAAAGMGSDEAAEFPWHVV